MNPIWERRMISTFGFVFFFFLGFIIFVKTVNTKANPDRLLPFGEAGEGAGSRIRQREERGPQRPVGSKSQHSLEKAPPWNLSLSIC